jgi:hypothetical protein
LFAGDEERGDSSSTFLQPSPGQALDLSAVGNLHRIRIGGRV